ncbi:MAG: ArsR/SmtB family transcription factor [Thermoplasmatota archaeon]
MSGSARPRELTLDELLAVLGNPLRREILARLTQETHYPLQLSRELKVSQQAIMKHLSVLKRYRLVRCAERRSTTLGPPRKCYISTGSFSIRIDFGPNAFEARLVPLESGAGGERMGNGRKNLTVKRGGRRGGREGEGGGAGRGGGSGSGSGAGSGTGAGRWAGSGAESEGAPISGAARREAGEEDWVGGAERMEERGAVEEEKEDGPAKHLESSARLREFFARLARINREMSELESRRAALAMAKQRILREACGEISEISQDYRERRLLYLLAEDPEAPLERLARELSIRQEALERLCRLAGISSIHF